MNKAVKVSFGQGYVLPQVQQHVNAKRLTKLPAPKHGAETKVDQGKAVKVAFGQGIVLPQVQTHLNRSL